MTIVVSLEDFRPSPRYDDEPWTDARIEEAPASTGPWTVLEIQPLVPVDTDPMNPAYRNFTTQLGTAEEQWYRIVFLDSDASTGLPTVPVQNVEDDRAVYASVAELAAQLKVNPTTRHNELMRLLKAAADEIDHEIGPADINGTATPYSNPPQMARAVNLNRASELWSQQTTPFGVMGIGGDLNPVYTAKNSWERHANQLAILKGILGARVIENVDLLDAMAAQIVTELSSSYTGELQVISRMMSKPTPPTIDMYPGDISRGTDASAFGLDGEFLFTVRARVNDNDEDGQQNLLLAFMDEHNPLGIAKALDSDPTLGGVATSVDCIDPTGYVQYPFGDLSLVGFQFTCRVIRADS